MLEALKRLYHYLKNKVLDSIRNDLECYPDYIRNQRILGLLALITTIIAISAALLSHFAVLALIANTTAVIGFSMAIGVFATVASILAIITISSFINAYLASKIIEAQGIDIRLNHQALMPSYGTTTPGVSTGVSADVSVSTALEGCITDYFTNQSPRAGTEEDSQYAAVGHSSSGLIQ